jgi:hypothetical protein
MFHPTLWDTVHAQIMYQHVSSYKSDVYIKLVCIHDVATVILFKAQIF